MDLQGSELKALKGATNSLKFCKSIYIEVSTKKFYEDLVDKWLNERKFYCTTTPQKDEEDILYLKKN